MKIAYAVILLVLVQPFLVVRTSAKDRLIPVYAEVDVSETSYLLTTVLQGIDVCGDRFVWRDRQEFRNATAHAGPLILVATDGPNEEEQANLC